MADYIKELKNKINHKKVKIAVIGLGYVGLPLAVEFANKGFSVSGLDVDKDRVRRLKNNTSYITDVGESELKRVILNNKFKPGNDFESLKLSDVVIICVPTPLKRKYHPDISFIVSAVKQIRNFLHCGQLVILESTTYPGTTEEVIMPILESSGLKCGKDFYLSFSPERIDPGNSKYPVGKIPKVIGGLTKDATDLTALLYRNIVDKVVPVSSARVAEAVKLLENTFRIVNIGLIDEMAMMAHKMSMDIWEIIEAAKTKPFGFMPFYPGPGVGGHCIPKDPLYLYWKARHAGFKSRFIKLASDTINRMPFYVVERLCSLLAKAKKNSGRLNILVIGVTYKRDTGDLRKSPALDIIDIFMKKKINVAYYDPLIPYLRFDKIDLKSIKINAVTLSKFDAALIATDHSSLDYDFILKNSKLVFDTRNVYKHSINKKLFKL